MTAATRKPRHPPRPKPVRNETDREIALARIAELMALDPLGIEDRDELELLAIAVQHYEREKFERSSITPAEVLASLCSDGRHSQLDVALGSGIPASTISAILSGKRRINVQHAVALAKFFGIRPSAFLPRAD